MMWTRRAMAGLVIGLLLGVTPALAFEETAPPPTPGNNESASQISPPAMMLGTPNAPADPKTERKGLNVFGYNVFQKLNFGLDVLYSEKTQPLEQQQSSSSIEEKDDVSVLGRIKRLF